MPLIPRAMALAARAEEIVPASLRAALPRRHRRAAALALGLALLAAPRLASAGERDACIDASEKGQVLRDDGKLQSARQKFLFCSRPSCPPVIRADCANWLANVDVRLPSVIVIAKVPDGHDTAEVAVTIDGQLVASRLDGKAIPLDPGEHVLRYEHAGSPPISDKVLIREGEQRRPLNVRFAGPGPASAPGAAPAGPRPHAGPSIPLATWVLGGVGVVSFGLVGFFGASALRDFNALQNTCTMDCDALAAQTKREQALTNIAIGVGGVALGAALVVLLTRPRPTPATTSLQIAPTPGGATIGVRASF